MSDNCAQRIDSNTDQFFPTRSDFDGCCAHDALWAHSAADAAGMEIARRRNLVRRLTSVSFALMPQETEHWRVATRNNHGFLFQVSVAVSVHGNVCTWEDVRMVFLTARNLWLTAGFRKWPGCRGTRSHAKTDRLWRAFSQARLSLQVIECQHKIKTSDVSTSQGYSIPPNTCWTVKFPRRTMVDSWTSSNDFRTQSPVADGLAWRKVGKWPKRP